MKLGINTARLPIKETMSRVNSDGSPRNVTFKTILAVNQGFLYIQNI